MIKLDPVGVIKNNRKEVKDDYWGNVISEIILSEEFSEEALWGLKEFSHVEILFYMDKVKEEKIVKGARHPRGDKNLPKVGIFSQRGKNRPNKLGLSRAKILKVEGKSLFLEGLDAVDGTPILDIKPYTKCFLPQEETVEPSWIKEIMENYFKRSE